MWRLTCDADATVRDLTGTREARTTRLTLDLTFRALTPAVGSDGQGRSGAGVSAETRNTVGKGHLEQAGRGHGLDRCRRRAPRAGRRRRGNRDKSWGPRRWGGPRMWRWFSINIGDDLHFGGIRIGTEAGDLHRGWVWSDGQATSIKEWQLTTKTADDGIRHESLDLVARDKRGREHLLHGDVLRAEKLGPASRGPCSSTRGSRAGSSTAAPATA